MTDESRPSEDAEPLSEEQWQLINYILDESLGRHGRDVDDALLELREDLPIDGDDLGRWTYR
jgi:hypothetical protein